MEQQLATESAAQTGETAPAAQPALPSLESWAGNAMMRHIPPLDWMIRKIDVDLRQRIEKLSAPLSSLPPGDPRRDALESDLQTVCKAVDRLSAVVRPIPKQGNHAADLPERLSAALTQAAASLRSFQGTPFGRRYPFHTFDRSKAEPVYASLLVVIERTERVVPLVRTLDADIDRRLLAGLVELQIPDDERLRQPIA